MEQIGGKPIDFSASKMLPGDLLVSPSFGYDLTDLPNHYLEKVAEIPTIPFPLLTDMNPFIGAGFYSSVIGPLPYAFGRVEPEKYWIDVVNKKITFIQ
jgi:hypothetical protein